MKPTEEHNSLALVMDAKNWWLDLPRSIHAGAPIPNSACRFSVAVTHNGSLNARALLFQYIYMTQA